MERVNNKGDYQQPVFLLYDLITDNNLERIFNHADDWESLGLSSSEQEMFFKLCYARCILSKKEALSHALTEFMTVLDYAKRNKDHFLTHRSAIEVISMFARVQNHQKAIEYAEQLVSYCKANSEEMNKVHPYPEGMAYSDMGRNYLLQESYNKALDSFNKAYPLIYKHNARVATYILRHKGIIYENLGKYDSALRVFKNAAKIFDSLGRKNDYLGTLDNVAMVYQLQGEYKKSNDLYISNLSKWKQTDIESGLQHGYVAVAKNYLALNSFDSAIYYLSQLKIKDHNYKLNAELFRVFSEAYEKKEQTQKALLFYKKYQANKDSMKFFIKRKELLRVENRKLLALKEKELEKTRLQQHHQYLISLGLGGFLLLFLVLVIVSFRFAKNQKRFNSTLMLQKKEISEQNLQLSELNTLKNQIFSIIAHDLKNPIHSLNSLLKIFQDSESISSKDMARYMSKVSNEMTSVTGLLDNLLYWGSSQMNGFYLQPTSLELGQYFDEVIFFFREISNAKGIQLINELENCSSKIFADPEILKFVLRNLISNAIKFSDINKKVFLSATEEKEGVRIEVRDEGIGMDESQKDKLFNGPLKSKTGTNSEKGAGLGLMLCKEFVEKSGGKIGVESQLDKGSTFWFILPNSEYLFRIR